MKKIIAAIVGLLVLATPALACWGDECLPDDGDIDTYFTGSGRDVYFNDMVVVDEWHDDDVIIEDIWTDKGTVTVLQNIDVEDKWFGGSEVVLNAVINVDPASFFIWSYDANVETYATWDGDGSVYRTAELGDVTSTVSAGADAGTFVDDIQYNGEVGVFKSIGLNTENVCYPPDMPDMPDMPECTWCI